MAKKPENAAPAAEAEGATIEPIPRQRLLQDLVESEHQLRHPQAFAEMCDDLGYEVVREASRMAVKPKG